MHSFLMILVAIVMYGSIGVQGLCPHVIKQAQSLQDIAYLVSVLVSVLYKQHAAMLYTNNMQQCCVQIACSNITSHSMQQ